VEEPLTEELLDELLSSPEPSAVIDKYNLGQLNLQDYLAQLLQEKGLKQASVVREAGLDATFGYQIFKGQRNASRNKILQLVFALNCSLREANRVLKLAGHNELYCKNKRDAIIIFCINNKYDLHKTDAELYRFKQETIS
jgi:transcriptional regulator with XRE-family HTH domain